jgi:palmitoyltransferase ZDHHC2/15/20
VQRYGKFMNGEWLWEDAWNLFALLAIIILDLSVAVLITVFLKFHIKLMSENKTTIENLEAKGKPFKSPYDNGPWANFYQVFGTNKYLWPFPIYAESGKPMGDGIYWT